MLVGLEVMVGLELVPVLAGEVVLVCVSVVVRVTSSFEVPSCEGPLYVEVVVIAFVEAVQGDGASHQVVQLPCSAALDMVGLSDVLLVQEDCVCMRIRWDLHGFQCCWR